MRGVRLMLLLALIAAVTAVSSSTSIALPLPTPFDEADVLGFTYAGRPLHCLEPTPGALSVTGVSDTGQVVDLDVLVLLDGISRKRGTQVMSKAATAYAPLRIRLKSTFRRVAFPSAGEERTPGSARPVPTAENTDLFEYSRDAVPKLGRADLVYLLTNKDIYTVDDDGQRNYETAGTAWCIGGVRDPRHAFAIGEGGSLWENIINDRTFPAKTAVHEIGHVMGAHHHHANCVEGNRSTEGGGEPSMCTVMWSENPELLALKFGTLESAVIRGYAVEFANP